MAESVTFESAVDRFTETVRGLRAGDWDQRPPCPDWDVRELFHHALVELLWVPPLVAGETLEQVGDRSVQTSVGRQPAQDYLRDLTCEMLMHHWDLTAALRRPVQWSDEECAFLELVAEAFAPMREQLAAAGVIAAPLPTSEAMSRQDRVLVSFGRATAGSAR